jgi:hypothetical protein
VAALSLLLQVAMAPGMFAGSQLTLPGLGSICHAATGDAGDHAPQPLSGQDCDHCLLCHAGAIAYLPPSAPPGLTVPVVASSPATRLPAAGPRDAAWPAYASRAPPAIG